MLQKKSNMKNRNDQYPGEGIACSAFKSETPPLQVDPCQMVPFILQFSICSDTVIN